MPTTIQVEQMRENRNLLLPNGAILLENQPVTQEAVTRLATVISWNLPPQQRKLVEKIFKLK